LRHGVFMLPPFDRFTFRVRGVGSVLLDRTRVGSIKVTPSVDGHHGLSETDGKDGPVATILFKARDSGGEFWEGHGDVVGHVAGIQRILLCRGREHNL
jgi:hypothetical protein